jgi:hypothetical protein
MPIQIPPIHGDEQRTDTNRNVEESLSTESEEVPPAGSVRRLLVWSKAWFQSRSAQLKAYSHTRGWKVLRRAAPRYYGRRQIAREQAFHDAEDEKSFRSVAFPDDEVVGVRCVWILDVYLPGQINHLVQGLKRLGLDEHYAWRSNPVESIIHSRSTGRPGGSIKLGYLVPGTRRAGQTAVWR